MIADSLPAFAAAFLCGSLALAVLCRKRRSVASWCFFAGMTAFALESAFEGMSFATGELPQIVRWQTLAFVAKAFLPGCWLAFSLTYSRGNYREFLDRWRWLLSATLLLPIGLAFGFSGSLLEALHRDEGGDLWLRFGAAAKALDALILLGTVLILMNLEKTFRSAVGTMRWRIKFLILGLVVIFGVRIYTSTEGLLFSGHNLALTGVENGSLIIGCSLMAVAYIRSGFSEVDIYPSHAVLHSSVTVLLVGGYLFVVGVLAQFIALLGETGNFQLQAFFVLLGVALLAVLLFSERLRQWTRIFVGRHLKTPQHDFRRIWTLFTQRTSSVVDQAGLCLAAGKVISESFNILSVTIWLLDERKERLVFGASTSQLQRETVDLKHDFAAQRSAEDGLRGFSTPFDLEARKETWAEDLRQANATQFRKGGNRMAVPLIAGDRWLGIIVLGDRVSGMRYTVEEMDLLKCIGDQIAAGLLNVRLSEELMQAKELEAFQTMSAFFVHDLKNAASSLSLMLKNLPVHFDDPAFRADALRGIGSTVGRINQLIGRLSVLREKLELKPAEIDMNQMIVEILDNWKGMPQVELTKDLNPLPKVTADREQIQNVFTNLFLNAVDAVGSGGRITVETSHRDGKAVLSVADDGCGMTDAFMQDSLFRPFHTTKKKGLGIGMFQSKMIVEAHRGNIHVESEPGKGTTFRVSLPLS